MPKNVDNKILDISSKAFADESECVHDLLQYTEIYRKKSGEIFDRAKRYVEDIRSGDATSGVEGFIHQFGLNNHEGVTIMCLAEALLRIPDNHTANALIHDKFKDAEWEKHFKNDNSLFVNASTWGLMLTGGIINLGADSNGIGSIIGKMISRLGESVIRESLKKAMSILGTQFVAGDSINDAMERTSKMRKSGYLFSYDMLGEGARTQEQSDKFFASYIEAIEVIGKSNDDNLFKRPSVSIKLSALHPRYEFLQRKRVISELLPKLKKLINLAMKNNICICIDAEEVHRLDISLIIFKALIEDKKFSSFDGIGFVIQSYNKCAIDVLDFLLSLAKENNKRIPLRLVKGAYWDSEIKNAQILGLENYPVFTRKSHTDVSYLACAAKLFENQKHFYPQFATHNALTVASILEIAEDKEYEFQRLYGMGEDFYKPMVNKRNIRVYAPVGKYVELLPYLIRRLLENGANTSFVNLVIDESEPIGELLSSPVNKAIKNDGMPRGDIALPDNIYDRKNSRGFDVGNARHVDKLSDSLEKYINYSWEAFPIVGGKELKTGKKFKVRPPSDYENGIGWVKNATKTHVEKSIELAANEFYSWSATPVKERADILNNIADSFEDNRDELISLLIREAAKTISDAIAEVREAVDFCRCYAEISYKHFHCSEEIKGYTGEKNRVLMHGRGVFVCISPWNFPLAIFTGQIVAALVAGNTVIAKPAEQTPLIAFVATKLMHKAGVPQNALHLLTGEGRKTGARLVKDVRIAGVAFTGSTETARSINIALASRKSSIAKFIAETGGQNAMIVDSTVLIEQTVDDVLISAFGGAGQRCSALRVLYIQDEIADDFIRMLAGAMSELNIGNTSNFAIDIGPVIDWEARRLLRRHIDIMEAKAKLIAVGGGNVSPIHGTETKGHFIHPRAFEINSIKDLEGEVFGAVLHVIRFNYDEIDKIINEINSTGYGLTFGIQSRIEERVEYISSRVRVGNIYVNRTMTGAVVGVHPFGGTGLSGTGPKAGGANYLTAFTTEQTISINTSAIGGNINLLRA